MPLPTDLELSTPLQKDWPVLPADVYQAQITDIEYKEIDNKWKREPTDPDKKQVMNFEFTIIEEGEYYGRKLWQVMSPTKPLPPKQSGKASWVWRIASALAGHALTYEEGEKYTATDINGFIGKQLRMTVSQTEPKADGKQFNNIESFLAVKQQLPPFDQSKVKDESAPAESAKPTTGYEKAKAVAETLPHTSQEDEIDVDSIPF